MNDKLIAHIAATGSPAEQVAMRAMTKTDGIPTLAETMEATQRNSLPDSAGMAKYSYEMAMQDAQSARAYAMDYLGCEKK